MREVDLENLYYFIKNRIGAKTWTLDFVPKLNSGYLINVEVVGNVINQVYNTTPESVLRIINIWASKDLAFITVEDGIKYVVFRK